MSSVFFVSYYLFTTRSFSLTVSGQFWDKGFDIVNEFLSFIEPAGNLIGFETDKVCVVALETAVKKNIK